MKNTVAVILAAGRGTRMKSDRPKVLHELLGKPMILYLLDSLKEAGITDIIAVAGYGSERLKAALKEVKVVTQKELLGSGDAILQVKRILGRYSGDVLVLYGDTPLIRYETIKNLITRHKGSSASATILTVTLSDPTGYGRIVRDDKGHIVKIVEEGDARFYEEVIKEINAGVYCFKAGDLFEALSGVRPENKKKEYYLTDVIGILHKYGKRIESISSINVDEVIGVNTRRDLAAATRILKGYISEDLMSNGVTIQDPLSTVIYPDVRIGKETIIYPYTIIESDVKIGEDCRIGPFTHIRPRVSIGDEVEIGNFVELVRTKVGDRTKVKHHTYLGDTVVGKDVNVGAGTITANFDGKKKNETVIEDGVFIGVGAILIAPVRVGKNAVVGAGCVVPKNHNVPKGATVVGVPARVLERSQRRER
ncbi:MAG: NTP transferase domain-containing protein [Candidatus Omnitrophica bacterium]|nr:NTP transferase domain-containing protein [Candidatus Omnitrophota bacterium]